MAVNVTSVHGGWGARPSCMRLSVTGAPTRPRTLTRVLQPSAAAALSHGGGICGYGPQFLLRPAESGARLRDVVRRLVPRPALRDAGAGYDGFARARGWAWRRCPSARPGSGPCTSSRCSASPSPGSNRLQRAHDHRVDAGRGRGGGRRPVHRRLRRRRRPRLLAGGVIIGVGVAAMHYLGMAAMSMQDSMSYNLPLLALSVLIAIVAGTAALWAGTRVSSAGRHHRRGADHGRRGQRHALHRDGGAADHPGPMPSMAVAAGSGMRPCPVPPPPSS